MNRNSRKQHEHRVPGGFTLVELIVVLVILVIIAGIAVPACLGYIDHTKKKEIIAHGQSALSATQAALSDIFSSNDNRFDDTKRNQTRIKADAAESTEFTVWNVKPLVDTKTAGGPEESLAVTEQIGSYTVGKALFKENENNFAAYNGTEWEWFEKESEALAYLDTDKTAQNVIHVWPYSPDLAFEPGGTYVADVDEDIIDSPEIKITKKVTLKLDEMKKSAFADEASESDTEVASVTVLFTTSNRTSTIETNWKPEPGETQIKKIKKDNRFTFDSQTLLFRVFRGFRLLNWKDEAGSGTYANLASIQEYVTGQEEEEFTFIAQVEADPKESATLDKDKFRDFITKSKKALITGIAQVEDATAYLGEDERFDVTKLPAGAVKVDDGAEDSEYAIYAWFEGDEVRWCTDASVAFMAPDCTDMLKSTNFQTFSFAGFDLYKTTSLAYMFDNCKLLTGIDFGQNVVAPNLTSMAGMFQYAYNLQSVSFDAFDKVGSTLDMNHLFFNLDGVRDPNDPSVGVGQEMVKAHIRNKDNGGSALKTIDFGKLPTITSFTDVTNMFAGQNSVEHLDLSKFDAGAISSCYGMFIYCQSLSDIDFGTNGWHLDNCENMGFMFYECDGITDGSFTSKLYTSEKLTNMNNTFCRMDHIDYIDLSGIIPVNVTDFQSTFRECRELKRINFDRWKVGTDPNGVKYNGVPGNVTVLKQTFDSCVELENIELGYWGFQLSDASDSLTSVTFKDVKKLKYLDLSGWNCNKPLPGEVFTNSKGTLETIILKNATLPELTTLKDKFKGYTNLKTLDLEGFQAKNATSLFSLVENCSELTTLNLKNSKFPLVTDLSYAFKNCSKLEIIDTEGWTTGAISGMTGAFNGCKALQTIDLTKWDMSSVQSFYQLFNGCTALQTVDMSGCDLSKVENLSQIFKGCTALQEFDLSECDLSSANNFSQWLDGCSSLTTVAMAGCDLSGAQNLNKLLSGRKALETVDMSECDLSSTQNISQMFYDCTALQSVDLSGADVSSVTNASDMFRQCFYLDTVNLGTKSEDKFDLASCTTMNSMFKNCIRLKNIDVSRIHTSTALTNLGSCFEGCFRLPKADLTNFNTENVTDMSKMFSMRFWNNEIGTDKERIGSGHTKQAFLDDRADIKIIFGPDFKTGKVTTMNAMFAAIGAKALDVSGFDLSSITTVESMFEGIDNTKEYNLLTTILASELFETKMAEKKPNSKNMFNNAKSIVGGNGTQYLGNSSAYAKIDRPGVQGYFTLKED